jgi:integrase/recombinase XerD
MLIIKTLLYTGIRVSELTNIKLEDVDFDKCQIKVIEGKGKKDRIVPFPSQFKEILMGYIQTNKQKNGIYLFESSWHKKYTTRGIQKMFKKYVKEANIMGNLTPHKMRHYLFRWLKIQGIDDALIQPYSGHETRQSLEIYSRLSIHEAQAVYNEKIKKFPL